MHASGLLLAVLALGVAGAVHAQSFPSKTVRIIVPFPPGGSSDLTTRVLADPLSKGLGQSVIVDNRPGAGAVIGYELGAKAAPDGHTLLVVYPSFVINPSLRRVQYDPVKDFRAVTQVISLPMILAVHPSLPARSMKELIALARAKPGEISYGTPGVGTIHHVIGELAKQSGKFDMTHVPYSGGGPSMTALAGGHIVSILGNVVTVAPFAKAGKVRALVVTTETRAEALPDVPTMREAGFPDLESTNWGGFVVPAATPASVVARLNTEIVRALRLPDIQEKFRTQDMTPAPGTPGEFAGLLQSEAARYSKVVRAAGMKAE